MAMSAVQKTLTQTNGGYRKHLDTVTDNPSSEVPREIAAEDLPRIFEKGYTGYNGRTDKKASGLGLYLCARICRNLGHGISAESEPDKGTVI